MKYLAYDPITLEDFDFTADRFRYCSGNGIEEPHHFAANPYPNRNRCEINGVTDVSTHYTNNTSLVNGDNEVCEVNDTGNIQEIKSIMQLADDINRDDDIPCMTKLQFRTPYKTSLCNIFIEALRCWLDKVKDTLVVTELEVVTKQLLYFNSIMNIISKYESVGVIKQWLKKYFENELAEFMSNLRSYCNCIAHEIFTQDNLVQNTGNAVDFFNCKLNINNFIKETGIDMVFYLDFQIENVYTTIENLRNFSEIVISRMALELDNSNIHGYKALPYDHQLCYKDINSNIFYLCCRISKFYPLLHDCSMFKQLDSIPRFPNTTVFQDLQVCSALCDYLINTILTGEVKSPQQMTLFVQKLNTLLLSDYDTIMETIRDKIEPVWNCILHLATKEMDVLKEMENVYLLNVALFQNKETFKLAEPLPAKIQEYFANNLLDLYKPYIGQNLRNFAMSVLPNKEIGFYLSFYLKIQEKFEKASVLSSSVDGIPVIVKATQMDPESYDILAKNRKVRIPPFIWDTIRQLMKMYANEKMIVKHNTSYHLVELDMNIANKTIEIICTPSIYAILSAFENRNSCDINQLMMYTQLKPNHFKSSLQKLRNEKLVFVKNGRVNLNLNVTALPDRINLSHSKVSLK